jgi:hypothetical protein
MRIGMICGNPGDAIAAIAQLDGFANNDPGCRRRCAVSAVYPIGRIN